MSPRTLLAMSLAALGSTVSAAESPAARDQRMAWWREARFGMFVHWGLYSGLAGTWNGKMVSNKGGMEWIQTLVGADTHTYAAAAIPNFKPKGGFAKEWAAVAKQAGCRYLVFTTKHHDGFSLHDSKVTNYDAADVTGRDLVKEIVEACRAEGLKVGFYHSVIDWQHPQYDFNLAKGLPYPKNGRNLAATPRDHSKYVDYLHSQVDELMSNYGTVDVLWWDYSSTDFDGDRAWRAADLLSKVRAKQPAIIMNNRLYRRPEAGFTGMGTNAISNRMDPLYGDFITPEQHIPATGMPGVDWETCMTMNTTWGFSEHDKAWKPATQLIRNLVDIASKGGNYLLNIGPTGDGSVPPESVERMAEVGKWMAANHESIHGTAASPFDKLPFDGRCTAKGDAIYLHLFERPAGGSITLTTKAKSATLLATDQELKTSRSGDTLTIQLPETLPDPAATVLRLR